MDCEVGFKERSPGKEYLHFPENKKSFHFGLWCLGHWNRHAVPVIDHRDCEIPESVIPQTDESLRHTQIHEFQVPWLEFWNRTHEPGLNLGGLLGELNTVLGVRLLHLAHNHRARQSMRASLRRLEFVSDHGLTSYKLIQPIADNRFAPAGPLIHAACKCFKATHWIDIPFVGHLIMLHLPMCARPKAAKAEPKSES